MYETGANGEWLALREQILSNTNTALRVTKTRYKFTREVAISMIGRHWDMYSATVYGICEEPRIAAKLYGPCESASATVALHKLLSASLDEVNLEAEGAEEEAKMRLWMSIQSTAGT